MTVVISNAIAYERVSSLLPYLLRVMHVLQMMQYNVKVTFQHTAQYGYLGREAIRYYI